MKKIFLLVTGIFIIFITGCASKPDYLDPQWRPGTIAVLPFTNESADVTIDKFARLLMYKALDERGYDLVALEDIDNQLTELGITEAGQLPTVTYDELSERIPAACFLYGNILEAKRVMLGLYFEKFFKADFSIIDCDSRVMTWQ